MRAVAVRQNALKDCLSMGKLSMGKAGREGKLVERPK
jgi:hypothetical protein